MSTTNADTQHTQHPTAGDSDESPLLTTNIDPISTHDGNDAAASNDLPES